MRIKQKILMVVVLIGVTLLGRLGFWQLSRAHEKQQLLTQWQQTSGQSAFSLDNLADEPLDYHNLRFRKVKFDAQLLNDHTILLDNKTYKGQVGYHVIVPAKLNNDHYILVNRGWVATGVSRSILPTIQPVLEKINIEGYLDIAYRNRFIHHAIESDVPTWPLRMQWLDITLLTHILDKNIYPMLVVLDEKSPYALVGAAQQKEWLSPERHHGYAVQWFSLALTLLILYLFILFKKDRYT